MTARAAVAHVNGITVAFDDAGQGDDVLLLVHGHPLDRSMWRPQVQALSGDGWRVIAPDLRGYGETTVVPGTTGLDVFAADLAALLDHLGVTRVVVGGLSMGGQIAMEFCRAFPERVCGLLLAATFPQAESEDGKRARRAMAQRLEREGMDGYARGVLSQMLSPGSIERRPELARGVLSMMRSAPPRGAAAALRGRAERPPYLEALAGLDVPALVVVGDEDAFTTRSQAEGMHALLAGSELAWMAGVGHMPNLEDEAGFNAAVRRLLGRVRLRA